jgi:hypothetical protein
MSDVIDPEYLQLFRERVNEEGNAIDWLWRHVHPDMAERRRERTAALLAAASEDDRNGIRGRMHVLLVGPGGTGKTEIKDWFKYNLDHAVGVGPDSSNAGLRYNANHGEAGQLAQAHEGVICIEELDKFDKSERDALYEAMSEGYYEVNKGSFSGEVPAACRVVAVANDVEKFHGPLRQRFDFVINVEQYGESGTITVADSLYDSFRDGFVLGETDEKPPLIPQYLKWVDGHRPGYPEENHEQIKELLVRLIEDGGFVGNIREKEAYLRTAYTIAKLNVRDIMVEDWVRAVDIIHPDLDASSFFADAL